MNAKHELFVAEYLKLRSAKEAAIRAGYAKTRARQTGSELLRKPEIAAAINEADKARRLQLGVDADWIVDRLVAVHEKAYEGAPKVTRDGEIIRGPDGEPVMEWSPSGATKPLELLMKHLGIGGAEQHEVVVSGEVVYTLTLDRQLPGSEDGA